jgi:6,7-dimethyl-8-ribityllumazine synthase
MLKSIPSKRLKADNAAFAIVASQFNGRYVDAMLRAAQAELKRAGARHVHVVRVPGAFEIPVVVARLARDAAMLRADAPRAEVLSAIICLGVILRGETVHAAHIGEAVSRALMEIQVELELPVIHEVLLLENEQQARARCLSKTHNRGAEAAQTALQMAAVLRRLPIRRPKLTCSPGIF